MRFVHFVFFFAVLSATVSTAQSQTPLPMPGSEFPQLPKNHAIWRATAGDTGPTVGLPTIYAPLHPSSVRPGSGGFTLHVHGADFVRGATVDWNGAPLLTKFVSQSRLNAVVPPAYLVEPLTANITVTNPWPGGPSMPVFFTVTTPTEGLTFNASVVDVGLAPGAVAAGDFNKDGKMDLAVLNMFQPDPCYTSGGVGTIQVLLGNGGGKFHTASNSCFPDILGVEGLPLLLAERFDGQLGLVAEYYSAATEASAMVLTPGRGDGTFKKPFAGPSWDYQGTSIPAFADFDNGAFVDFAITQADDQFPGILFFCGSSDGAFHDCNFSGNLASVGTGLFSGDFNGDGLIDLAELNFFDEELGGLSGPLGIILNTGAGSFEYAATQPITTLVNPVWAVIADFNNDGILDLAFADSGSTALTVLLGNGDGTFVEKAGQPVAGQTTKFIATADLNGDGKLDLVLVNSANAVLVYLGNGDGTFRTPFEIAAGNGASQVAIGDFNRDGRLDLAVANTLDNTVSLLIQSPAVTVAPSNVDFGKQAVGSISDPRRIHITNTGSATLHISRITASQEFSYASTCGSTVATGQTCYLDVVFKPTKKGVEAGNLRIVDNAGGSPQLVQLSGNGG
jgi:FG-GAP-like repeat/Abnormal spindle-like microcephaly-assoc'd, ASPM-SPD-2-Hydin/FG-GAP repeat